jgi:hypothetical protein
VSRLLLQGDFYVMLFDGKFDVIATVTMRLIALWSVTPCSPMNR